MTGFNDLPLELLPGIIQNVAQPRILASFCLVNKAFCKFTQPFLYHTTAVFSWHCAEEKIIRLFRTLSSSPELAKHVRKLEIRNFPLGLGDLRLNDLFDCCIRGLANTLNLQCFIWTRERSLRSDILLAVLKHPSLQELEITGHHRGNYDQTILPRFTSIRRIKLIMPSPLVAYILPAWLKSLVGPLQNLTIVCGSSTAVTDALLEQISENLSGLDELYLTGCQKVTHEGLVNALRYNKNGIRYLRVGDISSSFNLQEFDRQCKKAQLLNRLTSLTISIDYALSKSSWKKDIPSLVSSSPLERFELYYYTAIIRDPKEIQLDDLVATLISTHGPRLMRFSIHRLPISLKALYDVCTGFTNLEHLFVSVEEKDLELIGSSLLKATKLQAVHLNFVNIRTHRITFTYASLEDASQLVGQCSSTVTQIGFGVDVWQVVREVIQVGEDKMMIVKLTRCDQPEVPERFRVTVSI